MSELGPIGLTGAQARVVRYIEATGRPVRMADIAAGLEVVPRTATSIVDGLESAGLVVRAIDRHDRRSILVSLTPEGALLLDRLGNARRRTAEAIFSPLSTAQRIQLANLLTALCGDCEGSPGHFAPSGRGPRHDRTRRDR
jgi:DNA-binding MarR family transcriptional regulator